MPKAQNYKNKTNNLSNDDHHKYEIGIWNFYQSIINSTATKQYLKHLKQVEYFIVPREQNKQKSTEQEILKYYVNIILTMPQNHFIC